MIAEGRQFLQHQWWIGTFPGIAILLTVLAVNLIGDGLRDALDPRMRM
jgi:dipeptide transport system permease protein